MPVIPGGQLQVGDIIFSNAKIVRLNDGSAKVDCAGQIYNIGLDPQFDYDVIRPGDAYTRVVIATADWLERVRHEGASHAIPSADLLAMWQEYGSDFCDQIFADARRTLIVAGAIKPQERI